MSFLLFLACDPPPPEYHYGQRLAALELVLVSPDVGVHPDKNILQDDNNPFRYGLDGDSKWDILEDGPVAGFYAWATMLARIPTGEHQFYAANQAHAVYDQRLSDPDDLVFVRDIAIRGYQQMLDAFPGAVTFDVTGRIAFDLAPLAFDGIEALGGTVQGWEKIELDDGTVVVVKVGP